MVEGERSDCRSEAIADRLGDFARRANHLFSCPVLLAKIFAFPFDANHLYVVRIPAQYRGAFRDRHERRAGDAVDAGCAFDEMRLARGR